MTKKQNMQKKNIEDTIKGVVEGINSRKEIINIKSKQKEIEQEVKEVTGKKRGKKKAEEQTHEFVKKGRKAVLKKVETEKKVTKTFTIKPSSIAILESLEEKTGLSCSAIMDFALEFLEENLEVEEQ